MLKFMAKNGLKANDNKTGFLVMRPTKHQREEEVEIIVGDSLVKESTSLDILGLTISRDLKWTEHISKLKTKLRQRAGMVKTLSAKLPDIDLRGVLDGLIMSCVRYGLPLYGTNQNLQAIQVLVNNVARQVLHIKRSEKIPVKEILQSANLLSVEQAYQQSLITLTWNTLRHNNTGLENYFKTKTPEEGLTTTRAQTRGDLVINCTNRPLVTKTACITWNKSDENIRKSLNNYNLPKKLIKQYITKNC